MNIETTLTQKYTSLRIGGVADIFTPSSIQELQQFLKNNNKRLLFLGLGSNLLISDNGFDGMIVRTKNLNLLTIKNNIITAQSGVTLAKLSKFCKQHNQHAANFLSTIPGSIGGALAMNAGCFDHEIWNGVKSVQTIDKSGTIHNRTPQDFTISYRTVIAHNQDEYFISCCLQFDNLGLDENILQKRYDSQPIGTANCGSVFKNPAGQFAASLIEACNLRGFCIGGAVVSNKHANFIINQNNAKCEDVLQLIQYIKQKVYDKFAIKLELEVVIVTEDEK